MQIRSPGEKGEFVILFDDAEWIQESEGATYLRYTMTVRGLRLRHGSMGERVEEGEDKALADLARGSLPESLLEHLPSVFILEDCGFLVCPCKSQTSSL